MLHAANGVILALEGGALRETAYAPDYENGDFRSGAVTPEGCYLRFYSDGSLWPLSLGQPQQEVLRIAGVFPDASLLDAYRQAYPQVAVAVSPELPSQEDAFARPWSTAPWRRTSSSRLPPANCTGRFWKRGTSCPWMGTAGARAPWTACIPPFRIR